MRDIQEVLAEKEAQLKHVRAQVMTLKIVIPMLAEEGDKPEPRRVEMP